MTLKEEQTQFDQIKWNESVEANEDKCGSYEFCGICNKNVSYPCARASSRYARKAIQVATVTVKNNRGVSHE